MPYGARPGPGIITEQGKRDTPSRPTSGGGRGTHVAGCRSVIGTVYSRCFTRGFLLGVAVGSGFDHAGQNS